MTHPHLSRRTLLATGATTLAGLALATGAIVPSPMREAEAQIDPSPPVNDLAPDPYDPALAETGAAPGGGDGTLDEPDPSLTGGSAALAAPATPVMPPEAEAPAPTGEPTDAGMATSLGGSDVAVASVGGSHQVDAPRRKADKIQGKKKRP